MALPDWNSITAVSDAHSWLERTSIACFALLALFDIISHMLDREQRDLRRLIVERIGLGCFALAMLSEIVGYKYGQQNDRLSSGKISSLEASAKASKERSDNLELDLTTAKEDLIDKQAELANTQRAAHVSQLALARELRSVAGELSATQTAASEAASNLEAERKKRVELAASLLPREFVDQSGAIAAINDLSLPPIDIEFEYPNEREPRRMAEQIYFVFNTMRWPSQRRVVNENLIRDGIHIGYPSLLLRPIALSPVFTPEAQPELASKISRQIDAVRLAAETLRDQLRSSGITDVEAGTTFLRLAEQRPNLMVIEIGEKPNHALEATLAELGPQPRATPLAGNLISGNRVEIPEAPVPHKKQ